jgi:hypothetical protein
MRGFAAPVADAGGPARAEAVIVFRLGATFSAAGAIVFLFGRYTT